MSEGFELDESLLGDLESDALAVLEAQWEAEEAQMLEAELLKMEEQFIGDDEIAALDPELWASLMAEKNADKIKDRIAQNKKDLAKKKKRQEEETMIKYLEEERQADEQLRKMRETVNQQKRDMEEKRKAEEAELFARWQAEEAEIEEHKKKLKTG